MADETFGEVYEECASVQVWDFPNGPMNYANRLKDAHQRETAAKDAEIARLNDELFVYAGGHVITGAERCLREKIRQLEAEIARLKAALKPVMECKVYECDYGLYTGQGFEQTNVRSMCHNAVREAKRIMKEGETK